MKNYTGFTQIEGNFNTIKNGLIVEWVECENIASTFSNHKIIVDK